MEPEFYITLGDNQYDDGHLSDFQNYSSKSWGVFKDKTHPVPGNHEKYDNDYDEDTDRGDEQAYRQYFGAQATPQGKSWYSYDQGNWHFIALNSNLFYDHEQMDWLDADLAANTKPCTVAYFHDPLFTSGEHGNQLSSKPVWTKLEAAGTELVLNGHDHHYERTEPQRGVTYVVSGGGCKTTRVGRSVFTAVAERTLQFLHVEVVDDRLTGTCVRADGSVADRFTLRAREGT